MRIFPTLRGALPFLSLAAMLHVPVHAAPERLQMHRDGSPECHPPASAATWKLADENDFFLQSPPNSFTGLFRSQGLATDGRKWFFSWQYGLEIANNHFVSELRNSSFTPPATIVPGIPANLLAQGLDHIGDIDYHDGIIYASLDSTAGYTKPHVALYRATDLTYTGVSYELTGAASNPKKDIASWVAVDAWHNRGYGKEWQSGNTINVYNLNDWSFAGTITLDMSLERIQGAKVHGEYLYMSSDNSTRSVYRANLRTGHVEELFQLPQPSGNLEVEGIAVREAQDGRGEERGGDGEPDIYVEMVVDPDKVGDDFTNTHLHVALYHYRAVRERR
ncbi:MAG TPA: PEP-CTERM sorting domain-containing protein [Bradyrhizobium sp.]|nr:PEP-CTERM sorting domain-containing protein [Bradyrhizobium sp.]